MRTSLFICFNMLFCHNSESLHWNHVHNSGWFLTLTADYWLLCQTDDYCSTETNCEAGPSSTVTPAGISFVLSGCEIWHVWSGPDHEFHRVFSCELWKHFVEICCPSPLARLVKQLMSSISVLLLLPQQSMYDKYFEFVYFSFFPPRWQNLHSLDC